MITIGIYGIHDTKYKGKNTCATHDHSIAVMKDGEVVTVTQLERYTGVKHDNRLSLVITPLLEKYAHTDEAVRFVSVNSFMGNSFISSDGSLRIEPSGEINVENIASPAMCRFYPDGLRRKYVEAHIMSHEFAHIASILPFVGDFKTNSLLVHIDGGASESNSSVWYYDGKTIQCLEYTWNKTKTAVNNFGVNPLVNFILNHNPGDHLTSPGKLMGYSSYGASRQDITEWLKENNWFLDFKGSKSQMLEKINEHFDTQFDAFDSHNQFFMDIASCVQEDFEETIYGYIEDWAIRTDAEYLYYAGGASLNIMTNTLLEQSGIFKKIYVSPAANDSGLALGAVSYLEWLDKKCVKLHSPFLNSFDVPAYPESLSFSIDEVADFIQEGNVIGTCMGAAEVGPRALGHRSIIARADDVALRKRVSEDIKKREWYRPIAPVIADFVAGAIFDGVVMESDLTSYMMGQYKVKGEYIAGLKGVVHADGSVRPQIVRSGEKENSFLYFLLKMMYDRFGTIGLINTSFNIRGKPIVHYPNDACIIAQEIGLDGIVINDKLYKMKQSVLTPDISSDLDYVLI
jgi:carbamoyltransferase